MTLSSVATANTTVGPSQFADMMQAFAAKFVVGSPNDFKPAVGANRQVTVQPGACIAGGNRVRSTAVETVTCQAVSSGVRWDAIVLRVDWSTGATSILAIPGTSTSININPSTSSPSTTKVNRIPGVMYDALIAVVRVTSSSSYVDSLMDMRMWGGDGGPLRVSPSGIGSPNYYDATPGTFIATDRSGDTRRLDDDRVWRAIGTTSNPWKTWTPTLRYYKDQVPNGTDGGTVAGLGNGGSATGRYRIVDGILDAYVYIQPGATGATMGQGPVTVDLPYRAASWLSDCWSQGHLYNFGYSGDGAYDWHAEVLTKAGWTRGLIFSQKTSSDSRMEPYRAADMSGNPGTGVPFIMNGWTVGIMMFHLSYPVDE